MPGRWAFCQPREAVSLDFGANGWQPMRFFGLLVAPGALERARERVNTAPIVIEASEAKQMAFLRIDEKKASCSRGCEACRRGAVAHTRT